LFIWIILCNFKGGRAGVDILKYDQQKPLKDPNGKIISLTINTLGNTLKNIFGRAWIL
jgi:hypothetical protein